MFEFFTNRSARTILAVTIAGSALIGAGCSKPRHKVSEIKPSTSPTSSEHLLKCEPNRQERIPSMLLVDRIARFLGVGVEQVEAGWYGEATCAETVTSSQVDAGLKLAVEGIGPLCLATAYAKPESGLTGHHIEAICPNLKGVGI